MLVKTYDSEETVDTDTCEYCKGNSQIRKKDGTCMTSKEWCESVDTCAATIDWDEVHWNR